jgi:hypothetical protein
MADHRDEEHLRDGLVLGWRLVSCPEEDRLGGLDSFPAGRVAMEISGLKQAEHLQALARQGRQLPAD